MRVTQSWGMALVTSPGCCKMLPGECGGDTAPPEHGEGDTAPMCPRNGAGTELPPSKLPGMSPAGEVPIPWSPCGMNSDLRVTASVASR